MNSKREWDSSLIPDPGAPFFTRSPLSMRVLHLLFSPSRVVFLSSDLLSSICRKVLFLTPPFPFFFQLRFARP